MAKDAPEAPNFGDQYTDHEVRRRLLYYGLCTNSNGQHIIIIIKIGFQQCKAGREQLTPYQSDDPSPTIPTHRMKEEKGQTAGDKKGASC